MLMVSYQRRLISEQVRRLPVRTNLFMKTLMLLVVRERRGMSRFSRMELNTPESGLARSGTATVFKSGLTIPSMRDTGRTTRPMVMANYSMPMATSMRDIGRMIKPMVKVNTHIPMEPCMTVIGWMTSNMDSELRLGLMVLNMMVSMSTERKKAKAHCTLLTAQSSQATSKVTRSMGLALMNGLMARSMMDSGSTIRCVAKVL